LKKKRRASGIKGSPQKVHFRGLVPGLVPDMCLYNKRFAVDVPRVERQGEFGTVKIRGPGWFLAMCGGGKWPWQMQHVHVFSGWCHCF